MSRSPSGGTAVLRQARDVQWAARRGLAAWNADVCVPGLAFDGLAADVRRGTHGCSMSRSGCRPHTTATTRGSWCRALACAAARRGRRRRAVSVRRVQLQRPRCELVKLPARVQRRPWRWHELNRFIYRWRSDAKSFFSSGIAVLNISKSTTVAR